MPALPAVRYLCAPAEAQLIKALMRGILPAIRAKTTRLLGSVVQKNFVAHGEIRQKGPNSERCKGVLPAFEIGPAVTTHTPLNRDKAKSVENIAEGPWLAGTDDHRLLLRGTGSTALNMPAGCRAPA